MLDSGEQSRIIRYMPDPERLYSVKEAAEFAGKSELTIRHWIRQGKLQAGRASTRGPLSIRGKAINELMRSLAGEPEVA